MIEKFKILAKYIKDMSSETPDIETFLFVKDRRPDTKALLQNVKHAVKDFRTTAKELKAYPQIMRFLLANYFCVFQ